VVYTNIFQRNCFVSRRSGGTWSVPKGQKFLISKKKIVYCLRWIKAWN